MPAKIKRSPQTKRADRHMILAEKFAILRAALLSAEPSGKAAKWNDHVISALRRKRAELTGHIPEAERRLNSLREAEHRYSLRLFDPNSNPEDIKPRRPRKRRSDFAHRELHAIVGRYAPDRPGAAFCTCYVVSIAESKGMEGEPSHL
jgi:hypothetical protein